MASRPRTIKNRKLPPNLYPNGKYWRYRAHITREIGAIAKPRDIFFVPDLPKTRSGKILRRLLGDLVDRRPLGDVTSLQDDTVPDHIAAVVAAHRRGVRG